MNRKKFEMVKETSFTYWKWLVKTKKKYTNFSLENCICFVLCKLYVWICHSYKKIFGKILGKLGLWTDYNPFIMITLQKKKKILKRPGNFFSKFWVLNFNTPNFSKLSLKTNFMSQLNLNNYFNFHACLSIRLFVGSSIC